MENAFSYLDKTKKIAEKKPVVTYKITPGGGRVPVFPDDWQKHNGRSSKGKNDPPSYNIKGLPTIPVTSEETSGLVHKLFKS